MTKLISIVLLIFLLVSDAIVGQSNYSLLFDGEDDYVEFPFAENHDLFDDFSIEVWLKFDTIPTGRILSKVGWFDPDDTVSSYSIYFDENEPYKLIFSTWVGQFPNIEHKAISTLQVTSQQWQHSTVTYTEATYTKRIYINGVLAFNEDNTGNIGYNGRPLFIGAFKTNLGNVIFPFKGNIDEVRIWNKALSQEEIIFNINNTVIGNEDSLVGLWHINEGIGNTVFDSTIYNVNGIVNGAIWDDGFVITSVNEVNPYRNNFNLLQNYPNPFNPSTSIQYAISSNQFVALRIYDVLGKEVATLVNAEKPAGSYEVNFSAKDGASNLSSGIYFYKLQAGNFIQTKKMILLK